MGKKEGMKEATVDGIFIEVFSASTKAVYLLDCCSIHQVYAIIIKTHMYHSSLLRTFGLSATSTYDSYLPLIFGRFALI